MKKTIIALLALGSMAMGAEYTGTFSWASNADLAFNIDGPLTLTDLSANKDYKNTNVYQGTFTPNQNIGNGTGNSWTLTFTLNNTSEEEMTVESITLGTFLFNGGGNSQNSDDFSRPVTFTLTEGETVVATTTNPYANCGNDWENATTLTLGEGVTLGAGSSVTYTLTAVNAQTANNYGTFVGVSGATITTAAPAVPEPATATLSLLALAGLAARRRR